MACEARRPSPKRKTSVHHNRQPEGERPCQIKPFVNLIDGAVLALLSVAQLMVVPDATIVTVALPSAQRALHFTNDSRQWVVTAYALAFGSLLLVGGKVGDLFGKWALIAGLVGFSAASAVGGLAHSFGVLVAARATQGVFGALLAPAALSLLTVTFAGTADWARAFGIFGAVAGGAGALGLLLGGVLTQVLSWRWCFYVNLVIAVPTTIVALRLLVNHRPPARARIDIPGVLTWTLGVVALVFGFSNAATHGWGATATVVALIASPLLLTAFVLIERRVEHPLLPLHIVWDRARGGSYAALLVTGAGVFAVFLFLTYFMQQNLGFSPLKTGLAFLPLTVVLVITSTTVQTRVVQRTGVKPLVLLGMALGVIGMLLFTQLTPTSSYGTGVLPGLLVIGVGMGCIFVSHSRPRHSALRQATRASPPRWSTRPSKSAARSAPPCSQRSTPPPLATTSPAIPASPASYRPRRSTATRRRSGGPPGSLAWALCSCC